MTHPTHPTHPTEAQERVSVSVLRGNAREGERLGGLRPVGDIARGILAKLTEERKTK